MPTSSYSVLQAVTPAHLAWTVSEGKWVPYDHLLLLNTKLADVAAGRIRRLLVLMPPQHGKSSLTSHYFPAWYLGHHPDRRVILTSYEADFAASWGRKARNLLEEWGPSLFGIRVSGESSAADRWDIEGRDGGMVTAGVRGPITGRGAALLIIDDPVKNAQEAMSRTYREATWDWYVAVASTRLREDGATILIMTRWHADDLAGRLLAAQEEGGDAWEVVRLPALAEENDALGRAPGDALCPELFSREELERRRLRGSYWWAALFQQSPRKTKGNIFQQSWFRYFKEDGEFYVLARPDAEHRVKKADCWTFQTVDTAATEKDTSHYFVCGTWVVTPESDLLLSEILRDRLETPKHKPLMRAMYAKHRPAIQGVEREHVGLALVQELILEGLPVVGLEARGDKVARSYSMAARYEAGTVYHRLGAPWLAAYEDELLGFPSGEHDDQVDVASYAAIVLAMRTVETHRRAGVGRVTIIG